MIVSEDTLKTLKENLDNFMSRNKNVLGETTAKWSYYQTAL